MPPVASVHNTSWYGPGWKNRKRSRVRTILPVWVENSEISSLVVEVFPLRVWVMVGTTTLVPSGVMSVLPRSIVRTPSLLRKVAMSLLDRRSWPGAVVSSRRTWAVLSYLPPHCWNASVRPSADQERARPIGLKLPIHPVPGHAHTRCAPVASVNTSMAGPRGPGPGLACRASASLLPSGEIARPVIWSVVVLSGRCSGVRLALCAAGSMRRRKNFARVAPSRFSAAGPRFPGPIHHQRWADRTNVRSSAAPLTKVKMPLGMGGLIVASTVPVAVARTAACLVIVGEPMSCT